MSWWHDKGRRGMKEEPIQGAQGGISGHHILENEHPMNLDSSVNKMGKTVTQIFHCVGGTKLTFTGLLPETIKQGEFTKMMRENGSMLMINQRNIIAIEVFGN